MDVKYKLKSKLDYGEEIVKLVADKSPLMELLDKVRDTQTSAVEDYLKLRIKPRPFYIPYFLWRFLLSKIVYLQYLK